MNYKICSKCKVEKPATKEFFGVRKHLKFGVDCVCKGCVSLYRRKYYSKNSEKEKEQNREWTKNNPDYAADWQKNNKDKVSASRQRYRARKNLTSGSFSENDKKNRFEYYGNCCFYCGSSGPLEVEHRIPLSRGGSNHPSNIVPACRSCNAKKGTKTESEFLNQMLSK